VTLLLLSLFFESFTSFITDILYIQDRVYSVVLMVCSLSSRTFRCRNYALFWHSHSRLYHVNSVKIPFIQSSIYCNSHKYIFKHRAFSHVTPSYIIDNESPTNLNNPSFQKILIANRGEIALRIIRTCRSLGIRTVAIHSTVDFKSPHVLEADEAVCIGPAESSLSYLNIDAICNAILDTNAEAVHPGYGFLSENSEFARIVSLLQITNPRSGRSEHVKFIGPSHKAMISLGDKISSKHIAIKSNVNVVPGYNDTVTNSDEAVRVSNEIGYPVMIKASAGGGGRGMRICYSDDEVREGYVLSAAEAGSFFKDNRLFVEKYIVRPHHVEIQVLAGRKYSSKKLLLNRTDVYSESESNMFMSHLDILCFVERECSIQRRNQKILEESPSPVVNNVMRAEMIKQVKRLVRTVGYESAGTVEFLVDEKRNFYFLEMNTRLQVEHPVTEMVSSKIMGSTGLVSIDLVRGMIDIAAGKGIPEEYLKLVTRDVDYEQLEKMSYEERDGLCVSFKGNAIEARIYAEDPTRNFLPSTGSLLQYIDPIDNENIISPSTIYDKVDDVKNGTKDTDLSSNIRVDSGVVAGSIISQYYDAMISKIISYSPNGRVDAISKLRDAIDRYVIRGLRENSSFVRSLLQNPEFISGRTPTNFVEVNYQGGFSGIELSDEDKRELAAIVTSISALKNSMLASSKYSLQLNSNIRMEEVFVCFGGIFGKAYNVTINSCQVGNIIMCSIPKSVTLEQNNSDKEIGNEHKNLMEKSHYSIQAKFYSPTKPIVDVIVNERNKVLQIYSEDNTGLLKVKYCGAEVDILIMSPKEYCLSKYMRETEVIDTENYIRSPMPGTLVSYAIEDGDYVEEGHEICTVEAMKMQNVLRSERSGTIGRRYAEVGSSLKVDEIIVEFY